MSTLSATVSNSRLWKTTLAFHDSDQFVSERERLRSTFLSFRERAGQLAGEIRKDLPDLTVHDLSHLDALWEISSTIVGDVYSLTPAEAFVLGGAFLMHDLAMSVAATEGGFSKIIKDPRWADLVTYEYQRAYGRYPSSEEILQPEPNLQKKALFNLLRQIHAENAEKLAFLSFTSSDGTPLFLIEDTEIRQTFGRIIGQVAHSHWWSISEVEKNFGRVIGSPHWCPPDWTIDPLKLACILRVADAAHLDARRAPTFLKAFSNLSPASEEHWIFQEKLNKPYLGEDALVYTAGRAFPLKEASAWWLCLDTLRIADRELRSVDALFAEKGYLRFAAKRVAGVDTPDRLASYIQTDGWLPINAMVHVTDLPSIIHSIGGDELYGKRPEVALRELVQNSCDAIRARRVYEKRVSDFGKITVTLSETKEGEFWLEVADNGIGMSERVLTDFLLDFGRSFWGSPQMQEELPGLLSSGIKPIGKYGIGFFSVFMIAEQVMVATRRSDLAARETLVLEFSSGIEGRPILRPADKNEQLIDGGTHIKMKLKRNPYTEGGLLFERFNDKQLSLAEVCRNMCPAIETDLYSIEKGIELKVISANDWQSMDGYKLLDRMKTHSKPIINNDEIEEYKKKAAGNLRVLVNNNGEIVGRALISIGYALHGDDMDYLSGVVTVGGLQASQLSGICGILVGQPIRASRDDAMPIVSDSVLKSWAEEQTDLVPNLWTTPKEQAACAQYIWMCGGETKKLPICINQGIWMSADEIMAMNNLPDKVILIDTFTIDYRLKHVEPYTLYPNVFIIHGSGGMPGLLQARYADWPRGVNTNFVSGGGPFQLNLIGNFIQAIAKAWKVTFDDIAKANRLERETEVGIGLANGKEIRVRALNISKP